MKYWISIYEDLHKGSGISEKNRVTDYDVAKPS